MFRRDHFFYSKILNIKLSLNCLTTLFDQDFFEIYRVIDQWEKSNYFKSFLRCKISFNVNIFI